MILGLHHTTSRLSLTPIPSYATNTNTTLAFKQLCKDLSQIGIAEDFIRLKENEILALFKSQGMVDGDCNSITDQSRAGCSNAQIF